MSLTEFDQAVHQGIIKNRLYIIFGGIFLGLVLYYGIDEQNVKQYRFFDEGDGVSAEYWIRVRGSMYHLGEMVPHWDVIITLSVIGMLFALMAHLWVMECPKLKAKTKAKVGVHKIK